VVAGDADAADEGLGAWLGRPPVMLFATDPSGRCTLVDGRSDVLGLSDDVVGDRLAEVFGRDPVLAAALARALAGETVCASVAVGDKTCELRLFPRRDGGVDGVAIGLDAMESRVAHGYDELTGLAGRRLLFDRLRLAVAHLGRRGGRVIVLAINLDRFGRINEVRGYRTGDLILAQLAAHLTPAVRATDTIARLGGDKFALVCEDVATDRAVVALAERIKAAFERPVAFAGQDIFLSPSIGIALTESGLSDPEALLSDAEAAMLQAQRRGGGRWELFDPAMRVRARRELETEQALRRALDGDQFLLHYQPIIDLNRGTVCGVEALLRWDCPGVGLVPPMRFIPLAEEIGLIVPIGRWVLREAGRVVRRWAAATTGEAPFTMSVNVSAAQLSEDLVATVAEMVAQSGPPRIFTLELTESALMEDVERAIEVLTALRATGAGIAIDDFGTGYSSLSLLRQLPLDSLKVDRSFVTGIASSSGDRAIAEAMVGLAHSFGISAVAEGVETAEQLAVLRELGCDRGQGFYFARPMPALELERWLLRGPRWSP
jgi:diguanylate cyclase (GGDEF)-like protein